MVGKGQPPKAPEDKRAEKKVWFSPKEERTIETACEIEAPGKRFSTYVREAALAHAQEVIDENKK